ncbi:MAG: LysR family transcriptional regulator [Synergistaceae bacterium]|nr:LysR family transcriptional regulator [Synergistaceae bacterium]
MMTGFKMFMLAAEEMNFSRAAERAFVTQQCLSDHIKKLEDSYGVKFFHRKPKLSLTPEGEAMLRYVSRLQVLDEGIQKELSDLNAGIKGTVRAGLGMTRGEILIPIAAEKFREKAPNADLQVTLADTRDLEPLLLSGELDIFLGVSAEENIMFKRRKVQTENLYLIIPENMLREYFPGNESYGSCLRIFAGGVDLKVIHDIPFVLGHEGSRTTFGVRQYYRRNGLELNMPVCISDFRIHLKLCRTGKYATVAPYMHLYQLMESSNDEGEKLLVFPLLNIEKKYDIEIITHRDAPKLKVVDEFSRALENACRECCQNIDDFLQASQLCYTRNFFPEL